MLGTVTKIDQPKVSRNGDVAYQRIYFELEDKSWAHTDIVTRFRNFKFWKPIFEAGVNTIVGNLEYKKDSKDKIDADCQPYIVQDSLLNPKLL